MKTVEQILAEIERRIDNFDLDSFDKWKKLEFINLKEFILSGSNSPEIPDSSKWQLKLPCEHNFDYNLEDIHHAYCTKCKERFAIKSKYESESNPPEIPNSPTELKCIYCEKSQWF